MQGSYDDANLGCIGEQFGNSRTTSPCGSLGGTDAATAQKDKEDGKFICLQTLFCVIAVMVITFAGIGAVPVYSQEAASTGIHLRIGLTSRGEADSITIDSNALAVGFHQDGYFNAEATLLPASGFAAVRAPASYIRAAEGLTYFAQAQNTASELSAHGHNAIPVLVSPSSWSVYIGPYPTFGEAEAAAAQLGRAAVPPNPARIAITDGGRPAVLFGNYNGVFAHFASPTGITTIDSGSYRGVFEPFVREGIFTAVNIVYIEDYLRSVVPSEMPASWHIEALKAQAVAARTYALTRNHVHRDNGFQLCDTVITQVYRGVSMEHENSTRAVQETRGIMAYHNGELIEAVYFSSSGGHTEDSENVWLTVVPYLRAVREVAETDYMEWTRSFTLGQLTGFMSANGHSIGSVTAVRYRRSPSSSRMVELTFIGTSGSQTYTNDAIRGAFRHSADGNLQSTNFSINNTSAAVPLDAPAPPPAQTVQTRPPAVIDGNYAIVPDVHGVPTRLPVGTLSTILGGNLILYGSSAPGAYHTETPAYQPLAVSSTITGDRLVITGRGWGHGAGMSQFGARGMAEAGYNFVQILQHYYTDIEVR